jgi:hypothetical protein
MTLVPNLNIVPDDEGCMVIEGSTLPGGEPIPLAWVPMLKASGYSNDGWYWIGHQVEIQRRVPSAQVDPPIFNRTGITRPEFFRDGVFPDQPDPSWYPSGYWPANTSKLPNTITPLNIYGSFCLACHGSADGDETFAALDAILGKELRFKQYHTSDPDKVLAPRFTHTPPGWVDATVAFLNGDPIPETDPDILIVLEKINPRRQIDKSIALIFADDRGSTSTRPSPF